MLALILNTKDAANYLGLSQSYLEKLRVRGGGPTYVQFGKSIKYDTDDLDTYVNDHKKRSTSDTSDGGAS